MNVDAWDVWQALLFGLHLVHLSLHLAMVPVTYPCAVHMSVHPPAAVALLWLAGPAHLFAEQRKIHII